LSALQRELDAVEKSKREDGDAMKTLRADLDTKLSELQRELDAAQTGKREAEDALETLRADNEAWLSEFDVAEQRKREAEDELQRLQADWTAVSDPVNQRLSEEEARAVQLRDLHAEAETTAVESGVGELKASLGSVSMALQNAQQSLVDVNTVVRERGELVERMEKNVLGLRAELDRITFEKDQLIIRVSEVTQQGELGARRLTKEVLGFQAKVAETNAEVAPLRESLSAAKAEIQVLRSQLYVVTKTRDAGLRRAEDLERSTTTAVATADAFIRAPWWRRLFFRGSAEVKAQRELQPQRAPEVKVAKGNIRKPGVLTRFWSEVKGGRPRAVAAK